MEWTKEWLTAGLLKQQRRDNNSTLLEWSQFILIQVNKLIDLMLLAHMHFSFLFIFFMYVFLFSSYLRVIFAHKIQLAS